MSILKKVQAKWSSVKRSIETRIAFAILLGTRIVDSDIYQQQPAVKTTADDLIAKGKVLADANARVDHTESEAKEARGQRDLAKADYDTALELYGVTAQTYAVTIPDVRGLCLDVAERTAHPLLPPAGLTAEWDPATRSITVTIDGAPGIKVQHLEHQAPGETGFTRVRGSGTQRTIKDPAPGLHAFQACSVRAEDESDFFGPITCLVK